MSDDYAQNIEEFPTIFVGGIRPREVQPGFAAERVSQALKNCARNTPDRGIWIAEQADMLGIPEDTFRGYFYGKNAPAGDNLLRMVAHFGPRFTGVLLEPFGQTALPSRDVKAVQAAGAMTELRAVSKTLKAVVEGIDRAVGE